MTNNNRQVIGRRELTFGGVRELGSYAVPHLQPVCGMVLAARVPYSSDRGKRGWSGTRLATTGVSFRGVYAARRLRPEGLAGAFSLLASPALALVCEPRSIGRTIRSQEDPITNASPSF